MLLKWNVNDQVLTVQLPSVIQPELEDEWNAQMASWLLETVPLYVLDFKETIDIKASAYRLLIAFSQTVNKNSKQIASLGLNPTLLKRLMSDGVCDKLNPRNNLQEAMQKANVKAKPTADLAILNEFIAATQNTMQVQASTPCKPGKPYLVKPGAPNATVDTAIAGVISINSTKFKGSVALCFPKPVFLKIYSNMLGENMSEITAETADAAAELLNIIYGAVKVQVNKNNGAELPLAIPAVITGEKLNVRQAVRAPLLVIPFTIDNGTFQVEINLEAA